MAKNCNAQKGWHVDVHCRQITVMLICQTHIYHALVAKCNAHRSRRRRVRGQGGDPSLCTERRTRRWLRRSEGQRSVNALGCLLTCGVCFAPGTQAGRRRGAAPEVQKQSASRGSQQSVANLVTKVVRWGGEGIRCHAASSRVVSFCFS